MLHYPSHVPAWMRLVRIVRSISGHLVSKSPHRSHGLQSATLPSTVFDRNSITYHFISIYSNDSALADPAREWASRFQVYAMDLARRSRSDDDSGLDAESSPSVKGQSETADVVQVLY